MSGIWKPTAAERPDIWTATVAGSFASTNTVTITIGNRALVITLGTATAATTAIVAEVIKRAIVADSAYDNLYSDERKTFGGRSVGEFAEIRDVTVSGSVVTIYGKPGVPITLAITETASGSVTVSQVQTATGPRFWNNALNWSDGAVPIAADDLVFADAAVGPSFGLPTTLAADDITTFNSFTGMIGLPYTNRENPSLPYTEYRTRCAAFAITATGVVWEFGAGDGRGSRFIYVRNSSSSSYAPDRIVVRRAGEPLEGQTHAVYIENDPGIAVPPYNDTHYQDVYVEGGSVGLGIEGVFKASQLRMSGEARVVVGPYASFSSNLTDEHHIAGGRLDIQTSNMQGYVWRQTGGLVRMFGGPDALAVKDYYLEGGRLQVMREATIEDISVNNNGIFDCASSTGNITITNRAILNANNAGGIQDPLGRLRGQDIRVTTKMGDGTDLGNSYEITPTNY